MLKKLFVIGLVFAGLGLAQRGGGKNVGADPSGDATGTPAATNKMDTIAATLNLNKDQKKTVKTILEEGAKEAAPLRDQISKSRIVVGDAIVAKKSDEELKLLAKTSSDLSVQLTQVEIRTFAKIYATLDDAQKTNRKGVGIVLVLMNDIYHAKNWNE